MNLTDLQSRRAFDIADACDRIWANAFGTALAGPEGLEPQSVSMLRTASLSQEHKGREGQLKKRLPTDNGNR